MKHLIRKCPACGAYTLKNSCPKCGSNTADPHPPKYSPDDKYVRYRIADRYAPSAAGEGGGEEKGPEESENGSTGDTGKID